MPLMNLFEPLFLLLVLITLLTLITAAVRAVTGPPGRALRILRRLGVGAAVYFAAVIVTSALLPQRTYARGEPQCFDDWCIAVMGSHPAAAGSLDLDVDLQVSSRARRVPMGERGAAVYLLDSAGRRYDPRPQASDVPLDTKIDPGQAFTATRRFAVPADATGLNLVFGHDGGFPIGWFIITEGGWFQKPTLMRME